jgi:cyclopropane fatty-acyl-phospholipid synthase-like methyltransferase
MTILDRYIQRRRIIKAMQYISSGSTVLDIGCHQGELFKALGQRLRRGTGIDPLLQQEIANEKFSLIRGNFPMDGDVSGNFDHICLLAVLEHIPILQQHAIAFACSKLLRENGVVIITVPSPKADKVLDGLKKLRLIKGMSLEDHYGFDPAQIPQIFGQAGFALQVHKTFQAGFNNIFVLKKKQGASIVAE